MRPSDRPLPCPVRVEWRCDVHAKRQSGGKVLVAGAKKSPRPARVGGGPTLPEHYTSAEGRASLVNGGGLVASADEQESRDKLRLSRQDRYIRHLESFLYRLHHGDALPPFQPAASPPRHVQPSCPFPPAAVEAMPCSLAAMPRVMQEEATAARLAPTAAPRRPDPRTPRRTRPHVTTAALLQAPSAAAEACRAGRATTGQHVSHGP